MGLYVDVELLWGNGREAEAKALLDARALQETEDKLTEYADEVRVGRIVRGKAE